MNDRSKLKSADVREAARGRWDGLLAALCPELEAALAKPGRHVGCPVHGGRDGFRLFRDVELSGGGICNTCGPAHDGFALLRWLKGWSFPQTLEAVSEALGGVLPARLDCRAAPAAKAKRPDEEIRAGLRRVWAGAVDWRAPAASPLRAYLANRGLDAGLLACAGGAVRLHPGLRYFDEDRRPAGAFPALLALVCDAAGRPATIHRIYLSADGRKAPVGEPKKMMAAPSDRPVMGGAIRLGAPADSEAVDIAEGIETALAVRQATGLAVWSAVSASLMGGFAPPPGTRRVRVWADLDRKGAGQEAALRLQGRLAAEGVAVELLLPPEGLLGAKKADWLDVLNALGVQGFPAVGR